MYSKDTNYPLNVFRQAFDMYFTKCIMVLWDRSNKIALQYEKSLQEEERFIIDLRAEYCSHFFHDIVQWIQLMKIWEYNPVPSGDHFSDIDIENYFISEEILAQTELIKFIIMRVMNSYFDLSVKVVAPVQGMIDAQNRLISKYVKMINEKNVLIKDNIRKKTLDYLKLSLQSNKEKVTTVDDYYFTLLSKEIKDILISGENFNQTTFSEKMNMFFEHCSRATLRNHIRKRFNQDIDNWLKAL